MTSSIETAGDYRFNSRLPHIGRPGTEFNIDPDRIICDRFASTGRIVPTRKPERIVFFECSEKSIGTCVACLVSLEDNTLEGLIR
jgi:hypothetical protein